MNKVYDLEKLSKLGFNKKYIIEINDYDTCKECESEFQYLLYQVLSNVKRKFIKAKSNELILIHVNIAVALIDNENISMLPIMKYYDDRLTDHLDEILNMNDEFFIKNPEHLFFEEIPENVTKFFIKIWTSEENIFNTTDKENIWLFVLNMLLLLLRWKELK